MGRLFLNPSIGLRDETSSKKNDDTEEKFENDDGDDFDAAVPD